jgi:hypothetical protein
VGKSKLGIYFPSQNNLMVMRIPCLSIGILLLVGVKSAFAQLDASFPSQSVNYKVINDDPKDLNHLWVHVQPLTIDAMQMNVAVGSGIELTYLPNSRFELKGGLRGNLINALDFHRFSTSNGASITWQESKREQSQMTLSNSFSRFYSFEIGGMYVFKDSDLQGASKIILNDNPAPGNTGFSEMIEVDSKIRQLFGARLGISSMASTVSLQKALDDQNVKLTGDQGTVLSKNGTQTTNGFSTKGNSNELFTSFSSTGFYLGAAMQRIKNISIKSDRQGILSNNSIFTVYADLMFNPFTKLDDIKTTWTGKPVKETFSTSAISLSKFGGRIGAEVRYNQASFISLGAELGYRPSIQGEGFYGLIKLSIPTFSFGSTRSKVATNVGRNQSLTQ